MAQGNKQHAPEKEDKRREIYVPYKDLDILLDGGNQRVFLSRDQYEDLLEKAAEKSPAPHRVGLWSSLPTIMPT